jgi:uncharacterized protein Yka (UPF0111/DUF47 family)
MFDDVISAYRAAAVADLMAQVEANRLAKMAREARERAQATSTKLQQCRHGMMEAISPISQEMRDVERQSWMEGF